MRDETPHERIKRLAAQLKKNSSLDLIICPELFLSGYGSEDKIKEFCESSKGCLLYTSDAADE